MEIVISESLGTIQQNGGWHCARRPPRLINKRDSVVTVINAQRRQSNPQEMTTTLTPPGRTRETSRMMASREEPPPPRASTSTKLSAMSFLPLSTPPVEPPGDNNEINSPRPNKGSRMMASREETPPAHQRARFCCHHHQRSTPPVEPPGDDDDTNSPRPNKGDIKNDGVARGAPPPPRINEHEAVVAVVAAGNAASQTPRR